MTADIIGYCEVCKLEFVYTKLKKSKPDIRTCSKECSYALRAKTRAACHDPVEKICSNCSESFFDTTKKKKSSKCASCVTKAMVATRRTKGSYTRTKEQNEKLSKAMQKKYDTGWNPNTPEHREKLSKGMKDRWADGSMRDKTVTTTLIRYGASHWTQSAEGKAKLSLILKGRKFSHESRHNMSKGASRRVRENNNHYERGRGGFREDLGHYVRSSWEANFARILKIQGKNYEYEPKTFVLASGKTYTPDFFVENMFYEVKGYLSEIAKNKIESFMKEYPDIKLQIIDATVYDDLRLLYRSKILWEGK